MYLSYGSVHEILTLVLKVQRGSAKIVPRLLTTEQKTIDGRRNLRLQVSDDSTFLSSIFIDDESFDYRYDSETERT